MANLSNCSAISPPQPSLLLSHLSPSAIFEAETSASPLFTTIKPSTAQTTAESGGAIWKMRLIFAPHLCGAMRTSRRTDSCRCFKICWNSEMARRTNEPVGNVHRSINTAYIIKPNESFYHSDRLCLPSKLLSFKRVTPARLCMLKWTACSTKVILLSMTPPLLLTPHPHD